MSMVTTCSTLINDISTFKNMLNDKKIDFKENTTMTDASNRSHKVDLYIPSKRIGFVKENGTYKAILGRESSQKDAQQLSHDYTVTMIKLAAAKKGITIHANDITINKRGNTEIKLRNITVTA